MELLKIGNDALKVTLTREDMELYDIEFDMLDYANAETKRVIQSILEEARRSIGFEVLHDGLYVQAFRSRCGGCELFVTREGKKDALQSLFKFDSANGVIMACARLDNCGFSGKSELHLGNNGDYYLALCANEDEYIFLEEVAIKLPYSKNYLAEHTTLLSSTAVPTMAKLR